MRIEIKSKRRVGKILLNYKCKSGTVDDSNRCGESNTKSKMDLPPVDINHIKEQVGSKDPWSDPSAYHELSKVFMREKFVPTQGPQQSAYNAALKSSILVMEKHPQEFHDAIMMSYTQEAKDFTKVLKDHPDLPIGCSYDLKGKEGVRQYAKDVRETIPTYHTDDPKFAYLNGEDDPGHIAIDAMTANDIGKIDRLMAESVLTEPITVYSGVDPRFIESIPQNVGDQFQINTFVSTSRNESIGVGFAKYALDDAKTGRSYKASYEFGAGDKYSGDKKSIIEFQLKAGDHAIATEPAETFAWTVYNKPESGFKGQRAIRNKETDSQEELILNRKMRFEVVSKKSSKGIDRLVVKSI
jgi:hypothetical protein